jgi:hypothetical protein
MLNPELGITTLILIGSTAVLIGSLIIFFDKKARLKKQKKRR